MTLTNKVAALALAAGIAAYAAPYCTRAGADESPQVVKLTAQRFQFTPNEVHLKAGQPVTFELTSMDVKHGFFSRPLKLDALIPPGKVTEVTITPRQPGTYTVICDNFCGSGHGGKKMKIVVE